MLRFLKKKKGKNPNANEKIGDEEIIENDDAAAAAADFLNDSTISIERSVYNYPKFTRRYPAEIFTGFSLLGLLSELYVKHFKPSGQCATKQFRNRLPFIRMLKNYKIKEYLLADVIAGATVRKKIEKARKSQTTQ